jgi:hypothetical protein
MAPNGSVSERSQRLRNLAGSAENLAGMAGVIDQTLDNARRDLLALAGAARTLAGSLERAADELEVRS